MPITQTTVSFRYPTQTPDDPQVKKIVIKDRTTVLVKVNDETTFREYRFSNAKAGHFYYIGDSIPDVYKVQRPTIGTTLQLSFNLYGGRYRYRHIRDFSTLPLVHFVADGETATYAEDSVVTDVIPAPSAAFTAETFKHRLTFSAHHFFRSLPSPAAPRLFSRHHDLMRDQTNISTVEETENHRYDNVCNYYRSLIGFLWRDCNRHINRGKATPTGPEPVKTIAEVERILDAFEMNLMEQTAHREYAAHVSGEEETEDPHVHHWYADHDESTWTNNFDEGQLWLADEFAEPTEKIYDIKAEHTTQDDEGNDVVDTTALASEEAAIFITNFREAYLAEARVLGYTDKQIYIL